MKVAKPQAIILAVLIGVMVAVYARALRPTGEADHRVTTMEPVSWGSDGTLTMPQRSSSRQAQRQHLAQLEWGRDPFARGFAGGQASGLELSGILWDATQPVVIINGTMVGVGEEIEGYRVTEIQQDRVSLTDGSQSFQLHISPK